MLVYHVVQVVSPGHNTSYQSGRNWMGSHDLKEDAQRRADLFNRCRSDQCIGVEYQICGPVEETEPC